MRVLFVALESPYPPTKGHRIRTWSMLKALVREGHEVSLVGFSMPGDELDPGPLQQCCARLDMVPMPHRPLGRIRNLFSRLPYGAWRFRSAELRQRIRAEVERADVILCDGLYNMINLPERSTVSVLLNKDDVAHVVLERYLQHARNPLKYAYVWMEYRKLRRWEGATCDGVNRVLVCSETDRDLLRKVSPNVPMDVVPNVVDTREYRPAADDDGRTVIFAAAMDWYPNQDAAEFFVRESFPELRRLVPDAKFVVAGRNPSAELRRALEQVPGVELTGTVPDIRGVIAGAAVCAVPLRIGSGTRLKILEAGAMGKAVVSTTLGAEGLHFTDGKEIILADDPRAFARGVARLLGDPALRRSLGDAARRRVEREYSMDALQVSMREAMNAVEKSGALV